MYFERKTLDRELQFRCYRSLINYKSPAAVEFFVEVRKLGEFAELMPTKQATDEYSDARDAIPIAHEQLLTMMFQEYSPLKGKRILHIACNTGIFVEYLRDVEGAEAIGIDTDEASC